MTLVSSSILPGHIIIADNVLGVVVEEIHLKDGQREVTQKTVVFNTLFEHELFGDDYTDVTESVRTIAKEYNKIEEALNRAAKKRMTK